MDPFTISTGCIGLIAGIAQLSAQISAFVSSVRDARRDMDAVSRELSSLSMCLSTLRDDSTEIEYPAGLRENLIGVLKHCDSVVKEMAALLRELHSTNLLRKIQWTINGKDDMNRLRSSLESHKSALEIALDMTSLLVISAVKANVADVKDDTTAIRSDTSQIPSIKRDTSQIEVLVQEIGFLRLQLSQASVNDARAEHLQRFLDQSTTYAETVIDAIEDENTSAHIVTGATWEEAPHDDVSEHTIEDSTEPAIHSALPQGAPPVAIEVEEKARNDKLRASAVAMAQKMYVVQQNIIEEAKRNKQGAGQSGAHRAHHRALSDASSTMSEDSPPAHQYQNLQEQARKLAQARLAKIHDEHAEYRSYYGQNNPPRSKKSLDAPRVAPPRAPPPKEAADAEDYDLFRYNQPVNPSLSRSIYAPAHASVSGALDGNKNHVVSDRVQLQHSSSIDVGSLQPPMSASELSPEVKSFSDVAGQDVGRSNSRSNITGPGGASTKADEIKTRDRALIQARAAELARKSAPAQDDQTRRLIAMATARVGNKMSTSDYIIPGFVKTRQLKRLRLTRKEQSKLDKELEVAIRGKKSLREKLTLNEISSWQGNEVGSIADIKDLLNRGADPNYDPSSLGNTLFIAEMHHWHHLRRLDVLILLIERGAIISFDTAAKLLQLLQ